MRKPTRSEVGSFGGAMALVGAAAVLNRACPGGCGPCTSCATAIVPAGGAISMVAAATLGTYVIRRKGQRAEPTRRAGD